jgi:hypothetical protein
MSTFIETLKAMYSQGKIELTKIEKMRDEMRISLEEYNYIVKKGDEVKS